MRQNEENEEAANSSIPAGQKFYTFKHRRKPFALDDFKVLGFQLFVILTVLSPFADLLLDIVFSEIVPVIKN